MKYISLDTCVWLGLIKIGLNADDNIFNEICFWIEKGHLIHIVPENIIREWEKSKVKKTFEIIKEVEKLQKNAVAQFRGNSDLTSAYQPDRIKEIITERINRVDSILYNYSEKAEENSEIYRLAIERNLSCFAPNHIKDSFKDTINIISLMEYVKAKGYDNCIFSTINYEDFSKDKSNKQDLHSELIREFEVSKIEYVYCNDDEPFGNKLFNFHLRRSLPSFVEYLKAQQSIEEERILKEQRIVDNTPIENLDLDYLENIKHLDLVLSKSTPNAFDQKIVKDLINSHDSYRQYFLKNVGRNGMV